MTCLSVVYRRSANGRGKIGITMMSVIATKKIGMMNIGTDSIVVMMNAAVIAIEMITKEKNDVAMISEKKMALIGGKNRKKTTPKSP